VPECIPVHPFGNGESAHFGTLPESLKRSGTLPLNSAQAFLIYTNPLNPVHPVKKSLRLAVSYFKKLHILAGTPVHPSFPSLTSVKISWVRPIFF
jgi:hypothetical protein